MLSDSEGADIFLENGRKKVHVRVIKVHFFFKRGESFGTLETLQKNNRSTAASITTTLKIISV